MKTEPTINIQSEVAKIHSQFGMTEIANYRIEKLFEMYVKQSSPKINQLEWEELSREEIEADYEYISERVFKASTPFKYYTIHKLSTNIFTVNCSLEIYPSLNEAKAAVQSDFEKRVKECLE